MNLYPTNESGLALVDTIDYKAIENQIFKEDSDHHRSHRDMIDGSRTSNIFEKA